MTSNWLDPMQERAFVEALLDSFTLEELDGLLFHRLGETRTRYARGQDDLIIFRLLVSAAVRRQWAANLLGAALAENPRSPALLAFARNVGYANSKPGLEKVVSQDSKFQDFPEFLRALTMIETAVCQIAVPGGGGTGTLVGPDLVLTNQHVIASLQQGADAADRVARTRCIFDFKRLTDGRTVDPGVEVALAGSWLIEARPPSVRDEHPEQGEPAADELDFALIRLDKKVGDGPVGSGHASNSAKPRGWVGIANPAPPPGQGATMFVAQHPQLPNSPRQEPLQLAWGQTLSIQPHRLRHNVSTEHGSSGSLCFDAQLRPVALHHLGDPNSDAKARPQYNQAILLTPVVAWLTAKGVQLPTWTGAQ